MLGSVTQRTGIEDGRTSLSRQVGLGVAALGIDQ